MLIVSERCDGVNFEFWQVLVQLAVAALYERAEVRTRGRRAREPKESIAFPLAWAYDLLAAVTVWRRLPV